MSIGNSAPAWPSVIVSNGGISPSDHRRGSRVRMMTSSYVSQRGTLRTIAALFACASSLSTSREQHAYMGVSAYPLKKVQ